MLIIVTDFIKDFFGISPEPLTKSENTLYQSTCLTYWLHRDFKAYPVTISYYQASLGLWIYSCLFIGLVSDLNANTEYWWVWAVKQSVSHKELWELSCGQAIVHKLQQHIAGEETKEVMDEIEAGYTGSIQSSVNSPWIISKFLHASNLAVITFTCDG